MRRIASRSAKIFLCFVAIACSRPTDAEYMTAQAETVSIAYLKSLCTSDLHLITRDLSIEGIVQADNSFGEFPDQLIIGDRTGGIAVEIEGASMRDYPSGARVRIYCNGLALADYGGKLLLGAPPTGTFPTDRLTEAQQKRRIERLGTDRIEIVAPTVRLKELALKHVATLVAVDDLQFVDRQIGRPFCEKETLTGVWKTTDRHATDLKGDTIVIRIERTADYAEQPIRADRARICGIIDYFNGRFTLRPAAYGLYL